MSQKATGGGSGKRGRDKTKCSAYANNRRREKNKKRRLAKHLKHHPNDRQAFHAHANLFYGA